MARFAESYADQDEADLLLLCEAADTGRVPVAEG